MTARMVGWWLLVLGVTAAALVLPLAPSAGERLRVSVCRSTGGSCGYTAAPVRCAVLARDSGVASAETAISTVTDPAGGTSTSKALDGTATITVRPPSGRRLGQLAAERLGVDVVDRPLAASDGLAASYRFGRHDDADAWLDRYHRADAPVVAAAAGWRGDGVREGVRRVVLALGFDDPQAPGDPQGVLLDLPRQATGSAAYGRAGLQADPMAGGDAQLELDGSGRSTASGPLSLADNENELGRSLASQLGLAGRPTYSVTTDADSTPVSLTVTGESALDASGAYASSAALVRLRERGETESPGAADVAAERAHGVRWVQTLVLDLRPASNRAAFDAVFTVAGPLVTLRTEGTRTERTAGMVVADVPGHERAVHDLVDRIAQDAVFVRSRSKTFPVADAAASRSPATMSERTETTLLNAYSEDFAVPSSRLSAMPGCSQ